MRQNELYKLLLTKHLSSSGQSELTSAEPEETKHNKQNHMDLLIIFSGERFESNW